MIDKKAVTKQRKIWRKGTEIGNEKVYQESSMFQSGSHLLEERKMKPQTEIYIWDF
jgi:hypothetical protein